MPFDAVDFTKGFSNNFKSQSSDAWASLYDADRIANLKRMTDKITEVKADALVIFGSAGGQHCCDLASKIGVSKIFIHKYAGILSAYGLSMAV